MFSSIRYTLYAIRSRGFTLYYAILFGSLILAVGASMLNLSLKEFLLSASLRESAYAFFAADSGTECVLYWDLRGLPSGPNTLKVFPVSNTTDPDSVNYVAPENIERIRCDGSGGLGLVNAVVTDSGPTYATTRLTYNVGLAYCTIVEIAKTVKEDGSISTTINARGYNTAGSSPGGAFSCYADNNSRRVERAFLTYY